MCGLDNRFTPVACVVRSACNVLSIVHIFHVTPSVRCAMAQYLLMHYSARVRSQNLCLQRAALIHFMLFFCKCDNWRSLRARARVQIAMKLIVLETANN